MICRATSSGVSSGSESVRLASGRSSHPVSSRTSRVIWKLRIRGMRAVPVPISGIQRVLAFAIFGAASADARFTRRASTGGRDLHSHHEADGRAAERLERISLEQILRAGHIFRALAQEAQNVGIEPPWRPNAIRRDEDYIGLGGQPAPDGEPGERRRNELTRNGIGVGGRHCSSFAPCAQPIYTSVTPKIQMSDKTHRDCRTSAHNQTAAARSADRRRGTRCRRQSCR